jgi:hypothetical protein
MRYVSLMMIYEMSKHFGEVMFTYKIKHWYFQFSWL